MFRDHKRTQFTANIDATIQPILEPKRRPKVRLVDCIDLALDGAAWRQQSASL